MDIRKTSDKIYDLRDEKMYKMNEIYYQMAEYVKATNPELYNRYALEAEDILYHISDEDAMTVVRGMKPYGEHWTKDDIYNFVRSQGIEPCVDWYVAMNMMYNDYITTAQRYNVDTPDFYFCLARDFINDPDGSPHKLAKYIMD